MVCMAAIILGWKPDRQDGRAPDYRCIGEAVSQSGEWTGRWNVGRRRNLRPGTDAWLLLQGGRGGLIGHGIVTSSPQPDPLAAPGGRTPTHIILAVDSLLPRREQIPTDILAAHAPGVRWTAVRSTGTVISPEDEAAVRALWSEALGPAEGDPTQPAPGVYPQEALLHVPANRYEHDAAARKACIDHHGTSCAACRFSFEAVYGGIGAGFIQVHHIVPPTQLAPDYELDPIADLVPLCPNCHAMAHTRTPDPYTPAELRRIISGSGYLPGHVVSEREQQSLDDAQRILNASPLR